jgi:RHS repeat-associated protein
LFFENFIFCLQVLAEMDENNDLIAFYVYDGAGLVAKVTSASEYYYYHYDGLGSTVAITDSTAQIVNAYAYSPFGLVGSQETIENSFQYVGRFGVMAEGNGLYFMRARYYDPEVGRFINKDPIGYAGGLNLYRYVGNNPIHFVDPWGLQTVRFDPDTNTISFIPESGSVDSFPARNEVVGEGHDPLPRGYHGEVGYAGPIERDPRFGEWYIDTGDARGRDIHGGGTGLPDEYAPYQGWVPTWGCIRMQNQDIEDLVRIIQEYRQNNPGVSIDFEVTNPEPECE